MKKFIKISAILLFLWLLLQILPVPIVVLPIGECTITYRFGEVEFTEELTAEEVRAVAGVLNGKLRKNALISGIPACGFRENQSIQIGSVTYYLALDGCGTVGIGNSIYGIHYVHISDAERDILEEIFQAHGGKVPYI